MQAARVAKGKDLAASFDIDDHLAALSARVAPLAKDFQELMTASIKACQALYPDRSDADGTEEIVGMLKGAKDQLQLWRSSSARAGADAALTLIMSWHKDIKLGQIRTLREGGISSTKPELIAIREKAANYMAGYANTSELDADAEAYSDAEEAASGSDASESGDSGDYADSDEDDTDSDGGERRVPAGVRFTGSGKGYFAESKFFLSTLRTIFF